MPNSDTKFTISSDLQHEEIHYSIAGFWDRETMKDFLVELGRAAKPFIKRGIPFGAMGEMSEFVPQAEETSSAIRDSLMLAKKNGMARLALVAPSPLVMLQYRRIAEGLELEFFETRVSALQWLRHPR